MVMPAKQGLKSKSIGVGDDSVVCAANTDIDLVALSPSGQHCARLLVLITTGDFTKLFNSKGIDRSSGMVGLPANYRHEGHTSFARATVAFVAYF